MEISTLATRIQHARYQISLAEDDLSSALNEMRDDPRGQTVLVSASLGRTFDRLAAARQHLANLEQRLAREPA